jgi:hypothetical protein
LTGMFLASRLEMKTYMYGIPQINVTYMYVFQIQCLQSCLYPNPDSTIFYARVFPSNLQ